MIITTVKVQGEGYLVNGSQYIPKADGNKDYEAVKKWIDDGGIVGAEFSTTELLEQAIHAKATEIANDFETAEATPVKYDGIEFVGGYDSVMSIDSYVRLTKLGGGDVFTIWDIDGVEHDLTEAEVDELIIAIGTQSSINKFTKKNRKVALSKAETVLEVNAV